MGRLVALAVEPRIQKRVGQRLERGQRAVPIKQLRTNHVGIGARVGQVGKRQQLRKHTALAASGVRQLTGLVHVGVTTKLLVLELLAQVDQHARHHLGVGTRQGLAQAQGLLAPVALGLALVTDR